MMQNTSHLRRSVADLQLILIYTVFVQCRSHLMSLNEPATLPLLYLRRLGMSCNKQYQLITDAIQSHIVDVRTKRLIIICVHLKVTNSELQQKGSSTYI